MLLRKKLFMPGLRILARCALGMMFLLAIVLRVSLYHVETSDYTVFLSQWYDFIQTHGGFAALKYNFSNYNTPYLSLLALTTYMPIPKLVAIKTLSVVFDGVLGLFTYLILSLKYRRSFASIIGALVIVFAPTIFINSAAWSHAPAEKKSSSKISRPYPGGLLAHAGSGIHCRARCMEFTYHLRRTDHEWRCGRSRSVQWWRSRAVQWRRNGAIQCWRARREWFFILVIHVERTFFLSMAPSKCA